MRILIMLEQTDTGFAVQVPDLAVITNGKTIESAKQAAVEAIQINLEAYKESEQEVPTPQPAELHLNNPEYQDFVFAYVEVSQSKEWIAA